MRTSLLSAACVAALLAGPGMAQDNQTTTEAEIAEGAETAQATEGDQLVEGTAVAPGEATTTEVENTAPAAAEQPAAVAEAVPAASADPRQALAAAAARLDEEMMNYFNTVGTDMTGTTGLGGDPNAAATEETESAQMGGDPEAQQRMMQALDEFDAAIQQYAQSVESEQVETQLAQLQTQSQMIRDQIQNDPRGAMEGIDRLTQAAMTLPQAEISSEARTVLDRPLISSDGEEVGRVGNLLVTAEGRVEAVIVSRGGALGLGGSQVAVAWDQIQIQGEQMMVNLTRDQMDQLPDYVTD